MVAKARDARLLRALLQLAPPRGVARRTWQSYVRKHVAPPVRAVLGDLGQPVEGPVAKPEDLQPRAAPREPKKKKRAAARRAVTIRETLARAIERADRLLGDTLDERVDALLTLALTDRPALRGGA